MKTTAEHDVPRGPLTCWHLYVVRAADGSLYAGISIDVARRYQEHLAQDSRAASYLRARKPLYLAFSQAIGDRALALKVEHYFKRLPKKRKELVVASGLLRYDPDSGRIIFPE